VGFRAFTMRSAELLELSGWVRNLHDGRVESVAQGPEAALVQFSQRLRQGPPHGQVDSLTIEDWKTESFTGFVMRKDASEPCFAE
jgi:acylphosphatase